MRLLVSNLAQAKNVTPTFNSKWKYEILVAVVRVLQNSQNVDISSWWYAEDGKEMYKYL